MNNLLKINNKIIYWQLPQLLLVSLILAQVAGCSGTYGRLKTNPEVKQAFVTNQVPEEYNYYYHGLANRPNVVFGIESEYTMDSRIWREVIPNTSEFKELVYWIWEDYYVPNFYAFGADILNPQGKKVGIYYSAIHGTTFKFLEGNQIMVMPNTPFLWGPGDRFRDP